ncbi:orotidine-5'-phosphate decarboxylase [Mycoplasmatota bacterium]|nr:orotidine-5'-phosphate decarboxylase [Mycoplasmatota bacterium]
MQKDVIIALDFPSKQETLQFINKFNSNLYVKVGMELFYREGTDIIKELKSKGHKIFLDLKLHDIPNTVYKSMKNLSKLDIDMVNVHALGGIDMMKYAIEGLSEGNNKRPLCIAVTLLTSLSQQTVEHELLINKSINDSIMHYAENTKKAGLDGIVCSPLESKLIHEKLGNSFLTVTPGIRLEHDDLNDQVRVATPQIAKTLGTNYIVVGRSITHSKDPVNTYKHIVGKFIGSER